MRKGETIQGKWIAMGEQQDKLVEALNNIGMDIREIKTTLRHFDEKFNEKFGQVQKEVSNVKIQVGENEHEVERLKLKFAKQEEKTKENDTNIDRLFEKHREQVKEAKADRRWTVGTALTVVGILIGIVYKMLGI